MKMTITTGTPEGFFQRGRRIAQQADQAARIEPECILAFEDPEEIASLLTAAKLAVFREVKVRPGSITELSARLHCDRSAVKRDVDDLERAGMVTVQTKTLPGHGRMKEVRVVAERVVLSAVLT